MRRIVIMIIILACAIFFVSGVQAQTQNFDWGFNIDGTTYCYDGLDCTFDIVGFSGGLTGVGDLPSHIDTSGIDLIDLTNPFATGIGTASVTVQGAGSHFVIGYFDLDIGSDSFDENGAAFGTRTLGQTWEIDEPGDGFSGNGTLGATYFGDLLQFNFVIDGTLDNIVFSDAVDGQSLGHDGDAAMAIGWNFDLNAGEIAQIGFTLSTGPMPGGFHLKQTHGEDSTTVYFSSAKAVVPEPVSSVLFITGSAVFMGRRFLKRKKIDNTKTRISPHLIKN